MLENGSLFWKAKSGWNTFIFQKKFASTHCATRKIELTATRAKKRFNQERKERFRREKTRFWEIGEKKERNLALDFSPKMSPLTRESMIHFLLLLAKKAEVYHMKTNYYCSDLLRQYPEHMTKEQMYQVCHISKKTCLFLLESGLVPNIDSGKKTRRFKIKTVDVIQYLKDRDDYPELFKAPDGFYKGKGGDKKAPSFDEVFTQEDLIRMRQYYERLLKNNPDVMSVEQVAQFTGYNKNSVSRWCGKKELKCFYIKQRYQIPKEYLLDFLVSRYFIGISVKSVKHQRFNEQIRKLRKGSDGTMA